ncbi:MAG: TlpA disulfide reductase family protein [Bacteroidota bacterium]
MKSLLLLMVSVAVFTQSYAQKITFSSSKPVAGEPLMFTYDPAGGKLAQLSNVKCVAFTFVNKKVKQVKVDLTKEGLTYKGNMPTVDSTAFVLFSFNADGTKEESGNAYFTHFYQNGKPTAMAYYWEAMYWSIYGPPYGGIVADKSKAIAAFENAFQADAKMKDAYLVAYLKLHYDLDKVKGEQMIAENIAAYSKKEPIEENLIKVAGLYTTLRKKPLADSVYTIVKTKYPQGTYAYSQAANGIYSEKDAVKKEEKFLALIKDFNLDLNKKADATKVAGFYPVVASGYSAAKNNTKFEEYANKIENKLTLAQVYNSYAWAGAEKKENLEFAAKISKKSLDLVEAAKNDPMPDYYDSKEDYLKGLANTEAMFSDTYAVLLDHLGKNDEALKFIELAVNKNNFTSAEMNARYVSYLAKAGQTDKVVTYAERFIKEGQGTDQMKTDLKAAYKGTQPFDSYYAILEKDAIEKERAKFMKEMISMPAPKFTLANLKGETVSLAALKGKVVIVDYWATWCGPCIASFPGMQKAVDKYKNDPNVAFVFINTWQNEPNREKLVKDWAAANPTYTFNILLDTKNPKDESKFEVIEQYKVDGIPTKFIVDGNGNIRFKKVGFGGTADGTVKELDMMIALAKGSKEASK